MGKFKNHYNKCHGSNCFWREISMDAKIIKSMIQTKVFAQFVTVYIVENLADPSDQNQSFPVTE